MEKMDAIILAGTEKALYDINGKPMVQYVIDALSKSSFIRNIFVLGNNLEGKIENAKAVQAGNSVYESVMKGANLTPDNKFLISTCDIPLINHCIVDEYIKRCSQDNADIYLPFVGKNSVGNLAKNRKYRIPLKEGDFRMGYLIMLNKQVLTGKKTKPVLEEIFKNRKADISYLAKFFDLRTKIRFISKYTTKSLDIPFLEQEFSRLFGYKGKILISQSPEIIMDVDEPMHLEEIKEYMHSKQQ